MKKNSILFASERKGRIFTPVITTTANKMTTAAITKTLKKVQEEKQEMSIGYKRYFALPARIVKELGTTYVLQTNRVNFVDFLTERLDVLNEEQYIKFLKQL